MEQLSKMQVIDIRELPHKEKIKEHMLFDVWEKIGSGVLGELGMNIRAVFEERPHKSSIGEAIEIILTVYFSFPHETVVKMEYVPVAIYDIPLSEIIRTKWMGTKLYGVLRGRINR